MTPAAPSGQSVVSSQQPEKTGLILGLGFLGLCCFPFALVAGILGLTSFMRARAEGRSPHPVAIIGMVLALLSVGTNAAAIVYGKMKDAQRQSEAADLKAKLGTKREAVTLDATTACELAQLYFVTERTEFTDKVVCTGTLEGTTTIPSLQVATVAARAEKVTVCFARGHRWYVLSALRDADAECAPEAPKVTSAPKTEEDVEAEEGRWREAEKERQASARIAEFEVRLAELRDQLDAYEDAPTDACSKSMPKGAPQRIAFVERRMLAVEGRAQDDWDFLTQGEFRSALLSNKPVDRAKSIRVLMEQGELIAVLDPEVRVWPRTTSDDSFTFGELEGRLLVANVKTGAILCAMEFGAQSSSDVSSTRLTKLETKKHALERAIEKDFRSQVKTKANAALKKLSNGQLELDWGLFD